MKMHLKNNNIICTICTLLYVILNSGLSLSLRDVRVQIPQAVRKSEKAILKCLYDLEDDSLYSVKWYKGRREFYSFTPKETPAMKVFQFAGVKVDRSSSNESQIVLETVNAATSGKYSCEVSADAPSFHTLIGAGELEVVVVPGKDPIISGIRSRYKVGDIVRGNCTSSHSRPAANITWTVNGYETNPAHIRHFKPHKDPRELETVISAIHFVVTSQHFIYGKLKIRCTAFIHDVYWKSTERSIEENRLIKAGTSNVVHKFSEDYFDLDEDNVVNRLDTYMTHIKGDVSSLNANGCLASHKCSCFWLRLATLSLVLFELLQQLLSQTTKNASTMEEAKQKGGNCQALTTYASVNTANGSKSFETKTTKTALKQKQAQQYITTSLATQVSTISYENKSKEEYFQIKLIKENNQQQQQQQLLIVQEKLWKFQLKYSNSFALLLNCYQQLKHTKLQSELQLACDKTQYKFVCNSTMTTIHVANNFPTSIVIVAIDSNMLQYIHVCQKLCNKHYTFSAQFCTAFQNSCSNSLNSVTCLNTRTTGSSTLTDVLFFAAKQTKTGIVT